METKGLMFANDSKDLYQGKLEKRKQELESIQNTSFTDQIEQKLEQRQAELDEELKRTYDSFKVTIEGEINKIRQQADKIGKTLKERENKRYKTEENMSNLFGDDNNHAMEEGKDQLGETLQNGDTTIAKLQNRVLSLESTLKEKDEIIRKLTEQMKDAGLEMHL